MPSFTEERIPTCQATRRARNVDLALPPSARRKKHADDNCARRRTAFEFQTGHCDRAAEPAQGNNYCWDHESYQLAAALGAWLPRGRRAQEARSHTSIRED